MPDVDTQLPGSADGEGPAGYAQSRPRDDDRTTRKPLGLWDRAKFLVILTLIWFVLVWAAMADNPLLPFLDAMRDQVSGAAWVLVLLGIEIVRQVHFAISEHWAGYHRFWTQRVFGGWDRWVKRRFGAWTRFRLARAVKLLFWVGILAVVLGQIYDMSPVLALFQAPAAFVAALPFVMQLAFAAFFVIFQFGAIFWLLSRGGVDVYYPDDIKTRFSDVWGQDHVLDRVKENMLYLENPDLIERKGGYVPGGILLWGPPGTGKTLIAESVAGETGRPFVFVDPGAFINMFFGIGILKVKGLFRKLRKLSLRYGGVIVFFDEADSLGNRGAGVGGQPAPGGAATPWSLANHPAAANHAAAAFGAATDRDGCHGSAFLSRRTRGELFSAAIGYGAAASERPTRHGFMMGAGMGGGGQGTLQALLTELSGLKKPRGFLNRVVRRALGMRPKPPPKYRILVMMATNMPSALDEALLRPGRIDRVYHVGYPSKEGRLRTYEGYFSKVRHDITTEEMERLATVTPYATGATIKDLVNESLIVALRDDRDAITWRDVLRAKLLKTVGPPEGVEYIERERHAVAVHEACHAVMSYLVQRTNVIDTATIQKGQGYLGFVQPIPIEERFTSWRSEYEADVMVSLASIVGERMFFGNDNSSGVSGDLANATTVVLAMEGRWGMGPTFGSHAVTKAPGQMAVIDGTDRNVLETPLGQRVEARLGQLAEQARVLLAENRTAVLGVAHVLETHRTVTGEDVVAVVEGKQGPLVDGRSYRSRDTQVMLEAYHAEALAAHEGRDHALSLPVLVAMETGAIPVMRHAPQEHAESTWPDEQQS